MNSYELRPGNYLQSGNEIVRVTAVGNNSGIVEVVFPTGKVTKIKVEDAMPIELGSRLLTDICLFDENGNHVVGIDHHMYYLKFQNGSIMLANRDHDPVIHFWDVKNLHQFQNLYYALMGKELEVTASHRLFN